MRTDARVFACKGGPGSGSASRRAALCSAGFAVERPSLAALRPTRAQSHLRRAPPALPQPRPLPRNGDADARIVAEPCPGCLRVGFRDAPP
jgi:hypothetical protein